MPNKFSLSMLLFLTIMGCSVEAPEISEVEGATGGIGVVRPTTDSSEVGSSDSGAENLEAEACIPTVNQISFFEQLPNMFLAADENDAGIERARSGDFNGDGHMDMIITRIVFGTEIKSPISILLGDGTGKFSEETDALFAGENPSAKHPAIVLIRDFNGDGIDDAYIGDSGMDAPPHPGTQNTLILSGEGGTMTEASSNLPERSDQTHGGAAADIDLDGDVDIFLANLGGGGVQNYLLVNNGKGEFSIGDGRIPEEVRNTIINWYTAASFADINNDNFPDLILGQGDPDKKSHVALNDGEGSFIGPLIELPDTPLGNTDLVLDIQAVDMNADGYQDLLMVYTTGDYVGRYVQFLVNNGDGTFSDETEKRFDLSIEGTWVRFIQLADMNNDDFMDMTVGFLGEISRLYINDGFGRYEESQLNFDGGDLAIGDFDEDGWLDYVVSGSGFGSSPEFHATFINNGCN